MIEIILVLINATQALVGQLEVPKEQTPIPERRQGSRKAKEREARLAAIPPFQRFLNRLGKWKKMLSFFLVLLSAATLVYSNFSKSHSERLTKSSGKLTSPIKDKTSKEAFIVLPGGALMQAVNPEKGMFTIGKEKFTVQMEDGEAKLTATIKNDNDDVVVQVLKNDFIVAQSPLVFDRNFDDNALEVIDAKGNPIIQVRIDGNKVHFYGRFVSEGYQLGEFKPIFKYPGGQYPGVRIKP